MAPRKTQEQAVCHRLMAEAVVSSKVTELDCLGHQQLSLQVLATEDQLLIQQQGDLLMHTLPS